MSDTTEPTLAVFGAHAGCTTRSAIGKVANYSPKSAVGWNIVVDLDWGDINQEGVAWCLPPCIEIYLLHNLVAWLCLRIRHGPVPPLEVTKGLLDISSREL